jgi:hypothetical protein
LWLDEIHRCPNCLSHQRQTIFCGAAEVSIICVNLLPSASSASKKTG